MINDPNDQLGEGWIDHILTNASGKLERKGKRGSSTGSRTASGSPTTPELLVRVRGKKR